MDIIFVIKYYYFLIKFWSPELMEPTNQPVFCLNKCGDSPPRAIYPSYDCIKGPVALVGPVMKSLKNRLLAETTEGLGITL